MLSMPLMIAVFALVLALLALTAVIITSRKQAELIERQQQRLMMLTETAADVLALKKQLEQQQRSGSDYDQTEQLQQSLELSLKQQLNTQSEQLQQTVAQLRQEQQLLEQKLQQLADQDPGTRLYQRAAKLVANGATVEEIMQECDLPRAEAELVAAMRK